ncbi:hypothetical protein L6452_35902 [Arctium lappa]|uniref:Uncharacterized protein n=1 Tax=Arctium lappa TaxID=4217 RepID=A0ACB8Y8C8_ARCLA|nr:hypothetical protein L6452_35902 [Arctium lappa]
MDHLVFLSFRGEDTRMNFTSHLYNALIQEGIRTYKDDKSLEIGKSIAPELLNAIETTRFAIMVLSPNFATSKWCLEEIAKVVACEEQGKLTVIPVFYNVSPSDVRHQRNCFEQGFANHEADPEVTPQKVATWRAALARVGKIKGSHVTPHREESEVVREIITTILKDIPDAPPTDATTRLVGIESRSAFKGDHTDGYQKLSTDIVKLADGLPLALNVYGSILYGKNESYWKEMLKKLGDYPHEDVLKKLEIVYNKLDRDQRNIFIYIACFLKERSEGLVKDILTDIGLYSECGVTDLLNRSLITINHDDSVWMHDLLQLMCWEVLHKESERYNERLIAIKKRKDVEVILSSKPERMRTIEIINQEPNKVDQGDYYSDDPACFSMMKRLKFLRISNIHFNRGLDYLSNDLRILEWDGCSLKSLPSTFTPKHIYELQMCSSQLETLWEKDLDLPNLRSINLSFSKDLMKIPDLTSTTNLEKLNLEGCKKLTELHESILCQKKLRYMNLKGCTGLQNLGRSTMEMDALEALLLSGCSNLEHVPEFGQDMQCLEHLFVDGTSIKKLPDNLGKMCALKKLDASETLIEELPSSINRLSRLRHLRAHKCRLSPKAGSFLYSNLGPRSSGLKELDLSYCNLYVVPDEIGLLYRLTNLDLSGNDFVSLPASLGLLSNLRMLCLNNCKKLRSLPKLSLIVNEDTFRGLQILRYSYRISQEEVDASKVHAASNNSSPTISCLNCPKLAENENGSYLAERILNSYLQLRTDNWNTAWKTPEAVFEIVGGGREIPSGFKQLGSDDFILEGPWIGLAICAVVAVHHVDAYMDAKYMLTAHIHVEETPYRSEKWKVPVPINFLVAGLENQLVFYWTKSDDLQITMESREKKKVVSLSFEPTGQ